MDDDVEIVELSHREGDWVFWPGTQHADTGGLCNCGGHEGLGPSWHLGDCPGIAEAWKNRARQLHERLWDLWEDLRAGRPIDLTDPDRGPMDVA